MKTLSDQALEMIMRDVLEGIEDFSLNACFETGEFDIEILSISKQKRQPKAKPTKPTPALKDSQPSAEIIYPERFKRATG